MQRLCLSILLLLNFFCLSYAGSLCIGKVTDSNGQNSSRYVTVPIVGRDSRITTGEIVSNISGTTTANTTTVSFYGYVTSLAILSEGGTTNMAGSWMQGTVNLTDGSSLNDDFYPTGTSSPTVVTITLTPGTTTTYYIRGRQYQ